MSSNRPVGKADAQKKCALPGCGCGYLSWPAQAGGFEQDPYPDSQPWPEWREPCLKDDEKPAQSYNPCKAMYQHSYFQVLPVGLAAYDHAA